MNAEVDALVATLREKLVKARALVGIRESEQAGRRPPRAAYRQPSAVRVSFTVDEAEALAEALAARPAAPPVEPCARCGHGIEDHIGSACVQNCRHSGCQCEHWQRPAAPPVGAVREQVKLLHKHAYRVRRDGHPLLADALMAGASALRRDPAPLVGETEVRAAHELLARAGELKGQLADVASDFQRAYATVGTMARQALERRVEELEAIATVEAERHKALCVAVTVAVSNPDLTWPEARKALTDALSAALASPAPHPAAPAPVEPPPADMATVYGERFDAIKAADEARRLSGGGISPRLRGGGIISHAEIADARKAQE